MNEYFLVLDSDPRDPAFIREVNQVVEAIIGASTSRTGSRRESTDEGKRALAHVVSVLSDAENGAQK